MWHRAHNILMAPFSMQAMRDYLPKMLDIADQLIEKWARLNPGEAVDVPADMTRLTLDTIALCGFGYRFNSFYRDTPAPVRRGDDAHPRRSRRPASRQLTIQTRLRIRAQRQLDEDQAFMNDLVDRLIAERRAQGDAGDTTDLLGRMLTGVDKQTGERLPDENIRAQCITFLIAGHETTSGLLSFAIYYLMKNPDVLERARAEVGRGAGQRRRSRRSSRSHRLRYVRQILDETLRLWPTAPAFTRYPYEDTVIGGRYAIPADTVITVLTPALHRAPSVWGDDAEEFNPDHFAAERLAALPPNAYKPFGSGQRACIGRQFALQEATLVLGMLVQRFEFVDHLDYQLHTKPTLTIKPDDFAIQVRPRPDVIIAARRSPAHGGRGGHPRTAHRAGADGGPARDAGCRCCSGRTWGRPRRIATRLAQEGTERGFEVTLGALDEHVDDLPRDGATMIVCSSYNGTPPDNAAAFCRWIAGAPPDAARGRVLHGVRLRQHRVGRTYQAVPTMLDEQLEAHGGQRLQPRGEGNAAGDFDAALPLLARRPVDGGRLRTRPAGRGRPPPAPAGPRLSITLTNRQVTNPVIMSYRARPARVRTNRELLAAGPGRHARSVHPAHRDRPARGHALPGRRPPRRAAAQQHRPHPPGDRPVRARRRAVPHHHPEQRHPHPPADRRARAPAGRARQLRRAAGRRRAATTSRSSPATPTTPSRRPRCESLAGDDEESQARYREQVFATNRSVLDLLEQFPACRLPFEEYLDMLPPLRPRYYSISSSPLVGRERSAASPPAWCAGRPAPAPGTFTGVASGHLAQLPEDGTVFVFVREPTIPFRPPQDTAVPMIMVGAGHRAGSVPRLPPGARRPAGTGRCRSARSLLFFGCRTSLTDQLYADELRDYEQQGAGPGGVRVLPANRAGPAATCRRRSSTAPTRCGTCCSSGAVVLVCGNAATIAPGVRRSLLHIFRERTSTTDADAEAWLAGLRVGRPVRRGHLGRLIHGRPPGPRRTSHDRDLHRRPRADRRPADRGAGQHRRHGRLVLLPALRLARACSAPCSTPRAAGTSGSARSAPATRPSSSTCRTPRC